LIQRVIRDASHRGMTVAEAIQEASDMWLQARYGVLPVLYETEDAIKAYNGLRRKHGIGRASTDVTAQRDSVDNVWHSNGKLYHPHIITDSFEGTAMGYMITEFDPPPFKVDFFTTAWEMLPFSFVVDWVLGIGVMLAAFYAYDSLGKSQCASGVRLRIVRTMRPSGPGVVIGGDYTSYNAPEYVDSVAEVTVRSSHSLSEAMRAYTADSFPSASDQAWYKRLIDALSFFLGSRNIARDMST
jgi:hypothetical protein